MDHGRNKVNPVLNSYLVPRSERYMLNFGQDSFLSSNAQYEDISEESTNYSAMKPRERKFDSSRNISLQSSFNDFGVNTMQQTDRTDYDKFRDHQGKLRNSNTYEEKLLRNRYNSEYEDYKRGDEVRKRKSRRKERSNQSYDLKRKSNRGGYRRGLSSGNRHYLKGADRYAKKGTDRELADSYINGYEGYGL